MQLIQLNKASLVSIGVVLGALVASALILVIFSLKYVQTDPPRASEQSKNVLLIESNNLDTLISERDGNSNKNITSARENPEIAWETLITSNTPIAQLESLLKVAQIWIEKDGVKVIDQISATLTNTTVHNAVIASVLQSVALVEPRVSLQQALDLTGEARQFSLRTIIEVWATTDPQTALASVSILDSRSDRQTLQEAILRVWAKDDPQQLLNALASLPENLQQFGREVALIAIARNMPREAVRLLADLTDWELIDKLSKEIATQWSELDAHAALEWVLTNEFSSKVIQAETLMTVLANLTEHDPELAFKTARDQPIVLRGQHFRGLEVTVIQHLVEKDINAAIEMLARIRDEGLTVAHAYRYVGEALIRNGEFDRALKLGERLDNKHGQQSYNGRLIYYWARHEPEALFSLIEGLSNEFMKEQAARGLIRYNPETCALSDEQLAQLLTYLPDG